MDIDSNHRKRLALASRHVASLGIDAALAKAGLNPEIREASADWRHYVPIGPDRSALLLGPQIGDIASRLAMRTRRLTIGCPVREAATLIEKRASSFEQPVTVVHIEDFLALPFQAGQYDAAMILHPTAAMLGTGSEKFNRHERVRRLVEGIGSTLKPHGRFLIACRNGTVLSRILVRAAHPLGLNPVPENRDTSLALEGSTSSPALRPLRLAPRELSRHLEALGFDELKCHAPVPDPVSPKAILPLEHKNAIRYFLDHHIRRSTTALRASIMCARLLLNLGLFPSAVPFFYATARKSGSRTGNSGPSGRSS